ncbi:glycerol-3-phosphate 1-O-acyltransferase PlsY [Pelagibacterales bacterium SAG-MED38]|nr:glycerol-3-phosphate 1-O-acyltransferase PlsY [Pelagibacterales bacterium SAG-MED38]
MDILIIGIISYLMGSIPFGLILTKLFLNKDIREIGSGNIGATNVLRSGNKIIGYTTLIFDILKAVIPVIFVKTYYTDFLYLASLCAFLGHVFPVWLKFKGGKGVATYVGILFVINIYFGIIFALSWFVIFGITKFSSLSSLIASISIPVYLLVTVQFKDIFFFIIMFVLIFFTHRENIKRLKNKEENKTNIY